MHLIMWISEHKCIVKVISLIPAWNFEIFFSCFFIHYVRSGHISKVQIDESWENKLETCSTKGLFCFLKDSCQGATFFSMEMSK